MVIHNMCMTNQREVSQATATPAKCGRLVASLPSGITSKSGGSFRFVPADLGGGTSGAIA